MKGVDTNVLVRYIVQDDPIQFDAAVREVENATRQGERLLMAPIVLCEFVWVLQASYHCSRSQIADVLERILRTTQFDVIEKDVVWGALHDFKTEKGDFADYYLGRRHRQADAEHTLTFDKALRNSSLFKFIETDPHR